MFEAEAEGLWELTRTGAIRVPAVQRVGIENGQAVIAMEHIERSDTESADAKLGEQLAQLHRTTHAKFGWHRDNTIGLTPQINDPCDNWVEFFREQRLRYQLDLLNFETDWLDGLESYFSDHEPQPSLLHGDLWGGNWFTAANGEPVIFDPACYYGDREADIAMTYLFGGFRPEFYAAYEAAWPLDEGHERRRDLYNLYHVLNHANLFGGGYLRQAREMIERLS
jgi:fructosamine-3-kinase